MKPCRSIRRSLTLMQLGALEPNQAEPLREHLEHCPACQRYAAEVSSVSARLKEADGPVPREVSNTFHQQWANKVRDLAQRRGFGRMRGWLESWSYWRLGGAIAAFALAVIAWSVLTARPRPEPPTVPQQAKLVTPPSADTTSDLPRTLGTYHRVADSSLDALDDLLNRQARLASAGESYRVSTHTAD